MTSADVSEFTEVVLNYIYLLPNYIIKTVKIKAFLNQKLWVDRAVRTALAAHTAAFNVGLASRNRSAYKEAAYGLRKTVKAAKCRHRKELRPILMLVTLHTCGTVCGL